MTTQKGYKIAILQKGYGFFGAGKSLTEAIENSKEWLDSTFYHELADLPYLTVADDSALCWAYCTSRLGEYIETNGTPDGHDESDDYVLDLDARHLELLGLSE